MTNKQYAVAILAIMAASFIGGAMAVWLFSSGNILAVTKVMDARERGLAEEEGKKRTGQSAPAERASLGFRRKAFVFQVKPDKHAEYQKRHNPVWPEMEAMLKSHGVHNYSIFLNPSTSQLFAYVEIEDESRWKAIGETEISKKWSAYMRDILLSNSDNSPKSKSLQEVFHID